MKYRILPKGRAFAVKVIDSKGIEVSSHDAADLRAAHALSADIRRGKAPKKGQK